jgi:peptide/nickel transport system substrate-binding protein
VPANAVLVSPPQYLSKTFFYEYDPEKAKALLEETGYIDIDGDGFREKDGIRVKILLQSFVAPTEQAAQKIIKENLNSVGIDVELKVTDAGVMFGADTSKPDSIGRFNADLMMFQTRSNNFDPTAFMDFWTCKQIPQKANNWAAGNNNERWCNSAYDNLLEQTKSELDPGKRQAMFIQLNDMLVEDVAMIPLVWKKDVHGVSRELTGLDPTPWDSLTWNIQDWHFVEP